MMKLQETKQECLQELGNIWIMIEAQDFYRLGKYALSNEGVMGSYSAALSLRFNSLTGVCLKFCFSLPPV